MRRHISVQDATTKVFRKSFRLKNFVAKEGLPTDAPVGLGAGGPHVKSGSPDQSFFENVGVDGEKRKLVVGALLRQCRTLFIWKCLKTIAGKTEIVGRPGRDSVGF